MPSEVEERLAWHAGLVALDEHGPSVVGATELDQRGGLQPAVDDVLDLLGQYADELGEDEDAVVRRRTAFAVAEITALLRHVAADASAAQGRLALQAAWQVDRAWHAALGPR